MINKGSELAAVEIKMSQTPSEHFFSGINRFINPVSLPVPIEKLVIYAGDEKQIRTSGGSILPFNDLLLI